jgi:hypothetical protein
MNDQQAMSLAAQLLKNASPAQLAELRDLVAVLCTSAGIANSPGSAVPPPNERRRASRAAARAAGNGDAADAD